MLLCIAYDQSAGCFCSYRAWQCANLHALLVVKLFVCPWFFWHVFFCHPSLHGLTLQVQQISAFSLRFAVQVGSCSDVQQKRSELPHTVTKFGMSWLANERHKHKQQIGGKDARMIAHLHVTASVIPHRDAVTCHYSQHFTV